MRFRRAKLKNLRTICVIPDKDVEEFMNSEKEISKLINRKDPQNKIKEIQKHFKIISNIYNNNASRDLLKIYETIQNNISEKLGDVPQVSVSPATPIDTIISNYTEAVSNYNNASMNMSLWDLSNLSRAENEYFTGAIKMLYNDILAIEDLCSSEKFTWEKRSQDSSALLKESKKFYKLVSEKIDISKKKRELHKKLVKQCSNSVEYRKWWIWYCISCINNYFSPEIKTKLTDTFKPDKPLTINAITIKKPISSLSYTSLKDVYNIIKNKTWRVTINNVAINMNEVDPYLRSDLEAGNKNYAEFFKEFEPSEDLLLKDIKKEIDKREVYILKDISKIKPDIDMMNNIIDVLKQCQKNTQENFSNLLRDSLEMYIDGEEDIDYRKINGVLRGTLHILKKDTFGKKFDPAIYTKLCNHVRTIKNAFDKGNNENIIEEAEEDQIVLRGTKYKVLFDMFKNGGHDKILPKERSNFTQKTVSNINNYKRLLNKEVIIFDKGLMSTTTHKQIGRAFSEGKVGLKIFVPKGTKTVNATKKFSNTKNGSGEGELMLPPGTKLKVTHCYLQSDGWIWVEADVVK